MAYPGPPRRAAGLARYLILAIILSAMLYFFRQSTAAVTSSPEYNLPPTSASSSSSPHATPATKPEAPISSPPKAPEHVEPEIDKPEIENPTFKTPATEKPTIENPGIETPISSPKPVDPAAVHVEPHPIDKLIKDAQESFDRLLEKESHDLKSAAAEYRKRRGRHPPPGFDEWFKFAKENDVIVVEEFFDQIYHDLAPFWGLQAATMRKEAWDFDIVINIRNHTATSGSKWFWTLIWLNMTQTIEHLLPDMDLPLNAMDEPRLVTPWEKINGYMEKEKMTRGLPPAENVITKYQTLPLPGQGDTDTPTRQKDWEEIRPFWQIAARGCHPDSLARKAAVVKDFSNPPSISLAHTTAHTYKGYVSNFTLSSDFCHQPDIQALHGMMISPLSVKATKTLFPMFGGSKLPTNNEILLPAPMYWNDEERFSGGDDHGAPWVDKLDKVIWRGVATGGKNKAGNWRGFQRHRFVAMTNSTTVSKAESWSQMPENWAMPTSQFNLAAQQENRLGTWVGGWADTGFTELMCDRKEGQAEEVNCNYVSPYFKTVGGMSMADQFSRKYVPDIDGNSFSGRYRGFLMSTSLPIKATIFREWHDSRIMPWVHFVPMDNRFMDFYGIMEYFLGYEGKVPAHDAAAEKIAMAGQDWANKVLRKEDMRAYVLRLLFEYARLSDDNREMLGFVGDLL